MSITLQLAIVGAVVLGAAAYLVQRAWRSWRFSGRGCGGSCGCASTKRDDSSAGFIPAEQLTLRSSENHKSQPAG